MRDLMHIGPAATVEMPGGGRRDVTAIVVLEPRQ
jgi:hypothetical protein